MKPLIDLIFCCLEVPFGGRVFWLMSNCRFSEFIQLLVWIYERAMPCALGFYKSTFVLG
jgi:hypothetical protein